MVDPENDGGWSEYRREVIFRLRNLETGQEHIESRLGKIEGRVTRLHVKASIWGAIAGGVVLALLKAFVG